MKIEIPQDVKTIIEILNNNNKEAYIVGGCVRDCIMNIKPKDWDLTTSALPTTTKKLFKKTFDTGIEHGTITVVLNNNNYEITTYRVDGEYKDNRHPEKVEFTGNLIEDLERRDFTINAIAYHPNTGFIDPFNGVNDISLKLIKGVGNPAKRFQEDGLRMFRGIRFAGQLGFVIEEETYKALLENANLSQNLSIERVRDECIKLLNSKYPERFDLLVESKLLLYVNKELSNYIDEYACKEVKYIKKVENNILKLSILFRNMKITELPKMLRFLRLDNITIKQVTTIVENINNTWYIDNNLYKIRKFINKVGYELANLILTLQLIIKEVDITNVLNSISFIQNNNQCIDIKNMNITGNDLKNINIKDGKKIGETLNYLLDKVLENPELNVNEILIQMGKEYNSL